MWNRFTCRSKYIVYFITCSKCGAQYVRMTTNSMIERHGGHRREIQELFTTLGRHFANLSLQIIAGVKEGEENALQSAEESWISRLGTLESQGRINLKERKFKRSTVIIIKISNEAQAPHIFIFTLLVM